VATLYIIGSPIGNLGDITLRAIETLKAVDLIACEDTRRSLKLLNHLEIHRPLVSCYAPREEQGAARVIAALGEGRNAAYLSDAGTPALSDPGARLARRAVEAGHQVLPIPGPSAFAALVSVAGAPDKTVVFEGFLSPREGRRRSRLQALLERGEAFVLYESPFRILKLLGDLADIDRERYVCVGREMTKAHEEYLRGTAGTVYDAAAGMAPVRGEFTVLVSGRKADNPVSFAGPEKA